MSTVVQVAQGRIQGKECTAYNGKKYYSFEGIPYAKPPTGKLRFRNPQEPENWTGVRDATKPGNRCSQFNPSGETLVIGSEDCLYLNVYTPSLPDEKIEKLPVFFFVHGGRALIGHGDYYRPDYLIQNNVILVTINYRLHILGFMCLQLPEAPGNAGFKDTIMALKWVKNNIKMFNGDENNVTAFGESSGAMVVSSYVTSKMADGLVAKIISQSGSCVSDLLIIEDPISKAKQIASILGQELTDQRSLYNYFIDTPIDDLVFALSEAELAKPKHIVDAMFSCVVEEEFDGVARYFDESPLRTIVENRHKKLPVLMGLNSHEGALFLPKGDKGNIEYINDLKWSVPRNLLLKQDNTKSIEIGRKIKEFYFGNKEVDCNFKTEYINFISDVYVNRDVVLFAENYSKFSSNLFFYNFCYSGNMNTRTMKSIGLKGASHGDLVQYQFYKQNKADKCSKTDKKIVDFLSEVWCNFARNGKPTWSEQETEWAPYTRDQRLCLNIDEQLALVQYPNWNRIKFWLDNMGERSKL